MVRKITAAAGGRANPLQHTRVSPSSRQILGNTALQVNLSGATSDSGSNSNSPNSTSSNIDSVASRRPFTTAELSTENAGTNTSQSSLIERRRLSHLSQGSPTNTNSSGSSSPVVELSQPQNKGDISSATTPNSNSLVSSTGSLNNSSGHRAPSFKSRASIAGTGRPLPAQLSVLPPVVRRASTTSTSPPQSPTAQI